VTPDLLSVYEAQHLIGALRTFKLSEVGTEKWMAQHDVLEKLNIQAHHSAATRHDEFVVEAFVDCDKVSTLIHELIVIEAWKEHVMPKVLPKLSQLAALKAYMVLYHEATLCNLLEVILYHQHACESADDSLLEMIDYCQRSIHGVITKAHRDNDSDNDDDDGKANDIENEDAQAMLCRQNETISLAVSACVISILRFITEHTAALPMAVTARLLDTHDMALNLVPLIEHSPWSRGPLSKLEKFVDQKWVPVKPADRFKVTKTEAQVWLALLNLLISRHCAQRYHFNTHRKAVILGLKKYFTEPLLDQIPPLRDLQRAVEQLGVTDPPPPTTSNFAVIEQVPEFREAVNAELKNVDRLAETQANTVFGDDPKSRRKELARLADTYNLDNFDEFLDAPVCALPGCGKEATNRCSRCKTDWYCSRKCQVEAWSAHKPLCDMISEHATAKQTDQDNAKAKLKAEQTAAAAVAAVAAENSSGNSATNSAASKTSNRNGPLIELID
jgi:zinc finger MYND domain-containing protein 10